MNKRKITTLICSLALAFTLFSTNKAYGWDGKADGTGTHALIVTQAVEMIKNDTIDNAPPSVQKNFEILQSYLKKLQHGSTYPDYDPTAYKLYQDHFWDPDTDHNFTQDNKWYLSYAINQTGESQLRKLFALAKDEWKKGNYENSVWLLGKGLHYFGDFTTPYHPANVTAVDSTGHVKFETYVEERKDKYKINTIGNEVNKDFYSDTLKNTNLDNWITDFSKFWAKKSKKEYYTHASMSHSWKEWDIGATNAMHNSQIGSAGIIYRFLNEVSGTIQNTEDSNVKEIMLVIKTSNEDKAGTDHTIYFGLETNQGKKYEWTLDNPGNDFEKNQEDTYRILLKNSKIDLKDISKTWIRKEKYGKIRDDWKPEYVKVIINSSVKYESNINKWFGNNKTFYINNK
ncbi:phospholipase C [Clostridium botulinum]|uniref:Phospholipase C n=1 Tax=Clostridium botulinum TaxID=1491 RepID=A0A9Q1ZAL7_CLOBO|nr:phospholipase C [Clostridium botulinum]AEB77536.1 phospholipase C [Clostridium botulinum BKT015925]KEH95934.1 phospholipase C [Clostridium botulinum C/D str. Sp77]KEH96816.1 phospholipase C [Clostridium botulinum D str. 16868]KLU74532.1 phospholipase C [Clostridium botulinum V891]KOA73045.1 phospholipase C [Clostridium botulinum]